MAGRTIAALGWPEQVFAVAISWILKTVLRCFGLATLLGGLLLGALHADWDFSQISRKSQALYGPLGAGKARIDAWQQLRYVEDIDLWREVDYWATPIQALIKGAGDCEDYAIAKYFSLRRMGIPSEKLRITYVKALRQNRAHMVLTYYSSPQAQPLVLDSLMDAIKPASQRPDLLPVYAFNGEGLWLTGTTGNKKVGDTKRLSRWQDLLKKMQAEGFPAEPVY
ncbi:transglutaminase-like cysteine peptidase [Pseudomonas sp. SK2]|uniref:transglutaminase-like cysteine peptidase n=1 Tax=Pseudomonas sp. SK2 TaxID=2841063 RepID=UPI00192AC8C8|nr:transglutaminase-like cysteine peptidase [Pseudomonas sp. SK2]QQZ36491.1 transglutaminase-like cysteine peptidase [Pseudomonas sp. SK2]